jgi:hypothetical protein
MGFTIYYRNEEPVDEFTALRFMKEARCDRRNLWR